MKIKTAFQVSAKAKATAGVYPGTEIWIRFEDGNSAVVATINLAQAIQLRDQLDTFLPED